jgi:3-isopropylmalate dehydrogenase
VKSTLLRSSFVFAFLVVISEGNLLLFHSSRRNTMKLNIAILAGDGIGPEVTREATQILKAVAEFGGHDFRFTEALIGGVAITAEGTPLPASTVEVSLASDAVLLGAVGDNKFNHLSPDQRPESGLLQIRQHLGGFANLRPCLAFAALGENSPLRPEITKDVDILFVRELLGGLYFGAPRWWNKETGEAINTMRYTKAEVERVAHIAFQLAQKRRKKVTQVDKANVLECSQLWRATTDEIAKQYPDVTLEHQLVDSMAIHLMNRPRDFDVVLTENLFGDILSDESGVITGSLGMLPSATIGGKVNLYEPVHGSAPDIAGQGKANPLGAILTAAMVLRHSGGLEEEALAIEAAVNEVLLAGHRTGDIARGGTTANVTTSQMGKLVHEALAQAINRDQSMHAV